MHALRSLVTARTTWRRWAFAILGGALLMPYMMLGQLLVGTVRGDGPAGDPLAAVQPLVFLAVLPVVLVSALWLPVRGFEVTVARELLEPAAALASGPPRSWDERWRTATWFTAHLAVGGLVSGVTLALVPFAVWLVAVAVVSDPSAVLGPDVALPPGWSSRWGLPLAVLVLLGLMAGAAAAGGALARLAPVLLGPTAADRLAAAERRADELAQRNRLARELHDSVGHALSVVTLQAGAGARVLDRDPAFAREALSAIESTGRTALAELDHVLGLLRDDAAASTAPLPTLADLDALLARTAAAGVEVDADVVVDLDGVPAAVSRETYRIVQEGLTNALRHAGAVPVRLRLAVADGRVELDLSNPLPQGRPDPRPSGGRGLTGVRERVAVLGGEVHAGERDGRWHLRASVPL